MNTATRGVILAIAGVVLGVLILGQGFDDPTPAASSPVVETPTPTADPSEPAPTPDPEATTDPATTPDPAATPGTPPDEAPLVTHPANTVRLVVANGTSVNGAANAKLGDLVALRGYIGLNPTNVAEDISITETNVYYAEGFQADALQVANDLGVPALSVLPMSSQPGVGDLQDAHVLVILGPDIVQQPAG